MTTIGTKRPEYLLCLHCKGTNRPTDHVRTSCAVCNTTEYDTVAENFQQNTHILLQFSVGYNSVVILLDNFRKLWYKKNCDNSDNNDYIPLRCNFSVYQKKCSPNSLLSQYQISCCRRYIQKNKHFSATSISSMYSGLRYVQCNTTDIR